MSLYRYCITHKRYNTDIKQIKTMQKILNILLARDPNEPQYKATKRDKIYIAILVLLLILSTITF